MEILSPNISSLISKKHSIKIHTTKNPPPTFNSPFSSLSLNTPFTVSAHLNRPSSAHRRKNHLREKLIQEKVCKNPIFTDNNNNNIIKIPNLDLPDSKDDVLDENLDDGLMGIGSNPISSNIIQDFDVIQDFDDGSFKDSLQYEKDKISSVVSFLGRPIKLSRVGVGLFCGVVMFMALGKFFGSGKAGVAGGKEEEISSLEKEMLRRKIKARSRMVGRDSVVEVVEDVKEEGDGVFVERPKLDKEELMDSIVKAKALEDAKIQEIRAMARRAREIESKGEGMDNGNAASFDVPVSQSDVSSGVKDVGKFTDVLEMDVPNVGDVVKAAEGEGSNSCDTENINETKSVGVKSKIISSVTEAKDYLQNKEKKQEAESDDGLHEVPKRASIEEVFANGNPASFDVPFPQSDVTSGLKDVGVFSDVLGLDVPKVGDVVTQDVQGNGSNSRDNEKFNETKSVGVKSRIISSVKEAREYLQNKEKKQEPEIDDGLHELPKRASNEKVVANRDFSTSNINSKNESVKGNDGESERTNREKWMEDNFHEFEPLVQKIRGGFRNNYMVAREKVKEDIDLISELQYDQSESELDWMKDEKLREIVFQVRENELMGREPFYLMDSQDKDLFFKGLEKKVEEENEKLGHLHEYLHSNIENLDYGADGISLYDSPEKIIPRWKGPPPSTAVSQEFLDDYLGQRKALFAETLGNLDLDSQNKLQRSDKEVESKNLKGSKTVIEGSDGSVKPGKKSGKEFWQHTKKWSRGFVDSYNAENDPEIKATMKDIGKDLDRWITEKEIQEAADIMDKVPDKGKKFIAEKINKLKREMELFGPQAVVSKYSEYGDEEEIDYYWWLDLPFLLCIEIYTDGDGDERIGFYSLEMAADLELDPKPHHIIAFEDAGDCKNLCYIIQTHMEMLGIGNAFVVPQLPKDTYKEAKENGFNVTVIRKGELKLDVDQTLEEVEEKIVEIGSKMYHDKIMKSRNVNVDSVMKGVFGLKKTNKRRRLKRPTK